MKSLERATWAALGAVIVQSMHWGFTVLAMCAAVAVSVVNDLRARGDL